MKKIVIGTLMFVTLVFSTVTSAVADVSTINKIPTEKKSVYIVGTSNFYPIEYYNDTSKSYQGVFFEILNEISKNTGIDFVYIYNKDMSRNDQLVLTKAEMTTAYITDRQMDFVSDTVTFFTYDVNGNKVNVGIAFTKYADDKLIETIKSEAERISQEKINGYIISNSTHTEKDHAIILMLAILCAVFFLVICIILVLRIFQTSKKNKKSVMTDTETGIGNIEYFEHHFENEIQNSEKNKYYISYLIIDSNYLEVYHGDTIFSDVVKYTAQILSAYSADGDIVARITENGFAFMFKCENDENAQERIENIIEKLNDYINFESSSKYRNSKPVFHAAIYHLKKEDRNSELLIFNLRRNCSKIFGSDKSIVMCDVHSMNSVKEEKKLLEDIIKGLNSNEFKMYLQFIVDNKSKEIVSCEALSRWDKGTKVLAPGAYLETMIMAGLITKLDFYMFEQVCKQLEKWKGTRYDYISISCNFSRTTLSEDDFIDRIKLISSRYSFDRARLIMEITEDVLEKNAERAMSNVNECKKMGFRIALDDLGNGYTSLANLCDYPIDVVKIDRDILLKTERSNGKELFNGMVAFAHNLKLKAICEGVESENQRDFVDESECDYIQGWYYSKPIPSDTAESFVDNYMPKKR